MSPAPSNFIFLTRAGYSGSQPYTASRFTGDQVRSRDDGLGLSSVIPAVLNGSLSGWPYSGPDIAGFFQGERPVDGSGEKALWIHWVQLEVYKGMNRVTVPAPFYQIRFFVREGVDLRLSSPGFENP